VFFDRLHVSYVKAIFVTLFKTFTVTRFTIRYLKRLNVDIECRLKLQSFRYAFKTFECRLKLQVVLYFFVVDTGGTAGYDDIIVTEKLIRFEDLSYLVRLRE